MNEKKLLKDLSAGNMSVLNSFHLLNPKPFVSVHSCNKNIIEIIIFLNLLGVFSALLEKEKINYPSH